MATLKDIAEIAGVNKSTVSRALSGGPGVSEQKRREITGIADELGYIPDETAKILAGKNSRTIGIIMPEIDCNYYASVVGTIERELKQRGYSLIIGQTGFEFLNEIHFLNLFIKKRVSGIIFDLYNTDEFVQKHEEIRKSLKTPVVFIETSLRLPEYDVVEIDNTYGVDLAVDCLVKSGCEKIGFISEYISSRVRLPAFEHAMRKNRLPINRKLIKIGSERLEEGGYLRMKELITGRELPDGVFASYDTMAVGALKALREHGIDVPGDICLAGFDNIREASYAAVPLTTVAPPVVQMGRTAVETLLGRIEGSISYPAKHLSLRPELVERSTTGMRHENKMI